jgi:hypothetical protein
MICRFGTWVGAAALAVLGAVSDPITRAEAATISFLDGTFRAETSGEVLVHFFTGTAAYTSDLYGRLGAPANPFTFVGTSNVTPAGQATSLGFASAGDEIALQLFVRNTQTTYYSGLANRNPDNIQHVEAAAFAGGSVNGSGPLSAGLLGGFEDLFGGGDRDFDDVRFLITIAAVPAPGPIAGAGLPALLALGGFVWARRRKAAAGA